MRYDLSKLRAKGLVEKLPRSRRYRLPAQGYSVCLIFLKLFDRVFAPLTAALLHPIPADQALPNRRRSPLDRYTSALPTPSTISCERSALHSPDPSSRTKSSLMPPYRLTLFRRLGCEKVAPAGQLEAGVGCL